MLLKSGDTYWEHYILTPAKELLLGESVQGNPPLWFLLTLFTVRLIYELLFRQRLSPLLILVVAIVLSIVFNYMGTKWIMPIIFGNTAFGLAFFSLGNVCREWHYNKTVFAVAAIFYALFVFVGLVIVDVRSNTVSNGCYLQCFPQCLAGVLLINNIYHHFKIDIIGLHLIGRNSMVFYVWHWILMLLVNLVLCIMDVSMRTEVRFVVFLVTMAVFLPLFCKIPLLRKFC